MLFLSRLFCWDVELFHPCGHVLILFACCTWTTHAKVFVVEKISHSHADCKFVFYKTSIFVPLVKSLAQGAQKS